MPKEQCCHSEKPWKLWKEMQLSIKDLKTNSRLIISGVETRNLPWSLFSSVWDANINIAGISFWLLLQNSWILINLISLVWAIAPSSFSVGPALREQCHITTCRPSWPESQISGLYFHRFAGLDITLYESLSFDFVCVREVTHDLKKKSSQLSKPKFRMCSLRNVHLTYVSF